MPYLYGFKCGNATSVIDGVEYALIKIGICREGDFTRVLTRFGAHVRSFKKYMSMKLDIPTSSSDGNPLSPLRGTTLAGARGSGVVLSDHRSLRSHINQSLIRSWDVESNYEDVLFVLPFSDDIDPIEYEIIENHVRFRLGEQVHSNFKNAIVEHAKICNPLLNGEKVKKFNHTECALCSTTLCKDLRSIFLEDDYLDDVKGFLQLLIPKSPSLLKQLEQDVIDANIQWKTNDDTQERTVNIQLRRPVLKEIVDIRGIKKANTRKYYYHR